MTQMQSIYSEAKQAFKYCVETLRKGNPRAFLPTREKVSGKNGTVPTSTNLFKMCKIQLIMSILFCMKELFS